MISIHLSDTSNNKGQHAPIYELADGPADDTKKVMIKVVKFEALQQIAVYILDVTDTLQIKGLEEQLQILTKQVQN